MADPSAVASKHARIHWLPLESNPDVFTQFAARAGCPLHRVNLEFCDVFGFDDELLMMLPGPAVACVLLFDTKVFDAHRETQRASGRVQPTTEGIDLFYIKQFVGNACGTIAAVHSMLNAPECVAAMEPDAPLAMFHAAARGVAAAEEGDDKAKKAAEAGGALLAEAEGLHAASEDSAAGGQTEAPDLGANVDHHFVAFVRGNDGNLYELDGRRPDGPVNWGPVKDGDLMKSVAEVVKREFVAVAGENCMLNCIALCRSG